MAAANLTTLNSFGEPFMDAVCKNACSGHDVARVSMEEGRRRKRREGRGGREGEEGGREGGEEGGREGFLL